MGSAKSLYTIGGVLRVVVFPLTECLLRLSLAAQLLGKAHEDSDHTAGIPFMH